MKRVAPRLRLRSTLASSLAAARTVTFGRPVCLNAGMTKTLKRIGLLAAMAGVSVFVCLLLFGTGRAALTSAVTAPATTGL
jgi:hypothetical protein